MQLEHSFTVPTSVDAVWEALLDPERVAPCMPGATLTGVDGKKFTGKVKVKLGPVSMQYKGTGEYADTDAGTRTVVIEASGKDARGNGTASATVTLRLTGDAAKTEGTTTTDLTVTGKPAQFGRGMISDVGGKILEQFAANLADELAAPDAAGATETAKPENTSGTSGSGTSDTSAAAAAAPASGAAATGAAAQRDSSIGPSQAGPSQAGRSGSASTSGSAGPPHPQAEQQAQARESEPLDLTEFAGGAVAKRAVPLIGAGAIATIVTIVILRIRKSRAD